MSESTTSPRKVIIVGIDFSERSPSVFHAAERAADDNTDLHLVTVLDQAPVRTGGQIERLTQAIDAAAVRLRAWRREHSATHRSAATHVRVGDPAGSILQLAVDLDADLIVVGTEHRGGIKRLMQGSVAAALVRHASCPVLVVHEKNYGGTVQSPQIEPACPRCLETRQRTHGAQWWCDEHNQPHERPHRYGLSDPVADEMFDANVIPTGIRFF